MEGVGRPAGPVGWAFAQLGWPAGPQMAQWGGRLFLFLVRFVFSFYLFIYFTFLFYFILIYLDIFKKGVRCTIIT